MITAKDNRYLKMMRELKQKKYRQRYGLFLAEGKRLILDFLAAGLSPHLVLYRESFHDIACLEKLATAADRLLAVDDQLFNALADTEHSQGLLAAFTMPCPDLQAFLRQPCRLLLVVSGVRDPGNLGAILRNAAAAAVDGVLLERGTVDLFNPKVVRATMGALIKIPVFYDLTASEIFEQLYDRGGRIFMADMQGETPYWQLPLTGGCIVLLGGEAAGPSEYWQNKKLPKTFIPLQNDIESLNVAMAAGIIAFDFQRRCLK